ADTRGLFGPAGWVLGSTIFATGAWLAGMLAPPRLLRALRRGGGALAVWLRPAALPLVLAATGTVLVTIAVVVFHCRPVMVDEIAQFFQARIFAAGLVKSLPPALPEFFTTQHLIVDEHGWYAQYPPGHSALLALGLWGGAPWLVPILFSLGTIVVAVAFARRIYGEAVAGVTAALFLLSPFFLFMGARRRWLRSAGELAPHLQLGHHRRPLAPGIHQALGREPRPRFPRVTVGRAAHAVDGPRRSTLEPEHAERVPVREPGPGLGRGRRLLRARPG